MIYVEEKCAARKKAIIRKKVHQSAIIFKAKLWYCEYKKESSWKTFMRDDHKHSFKFASPEKKRKLSFSTCRCGRRFISATVAKVTGVVVFVPAKFNTAACNNAVCM